MATKTSEETVLALVGGPCAGQAVWASGLRHGWAGWAPEIWVCRPVRRAVLPGPWWRYVRGTDGYGWDGGVSRVGYR